MATPPASPAPAWDKRSVGDLAYFGGTPLFAETLHVGRPNIGDRDEFLSRISAILDARWFTNDGAQVRELEVRLATTLGVRNCIAVCNGTVAIELLCSVLGLSGEVIVPSFTFVATPHAVTWRGLRAVFCDIDARTHTLDPTAVERAITPRTSAILGVHLWGHPCRTDVLQRLAESHSLKLFFDAAHALLCSHAGSMIGSFGVAETFSLHATKFVSAGEGGAITTNDDALARELRLTRNFGFSGLDNVVRVGTNAKLSEWAAAFALSALRDADRLVEANRINYDRYQRDLSGLQGVRLLPYDEQERCNYQYIVIEIDAELFGVDRDRVLQLLHAENVRARRYFWPGSHRQEPYRSDPFYADLHLPATDAVAGRVLVLPTGECIGARTITSMVDLLRFISKNAQDIVARMRTST